MIQKRWIWLPVSIMFFVSVWAIMAHLHSQTMVRQKHIRQRDKNNILWEAVSSHNTALAERMLEEGADPNSARYGFDGHRTTRDPSCLMWAATGSDYPMTRLLVAHGALDEAFAVGIGPPTTALSDAQFELKFTTANPTMREIVPVSPNGYRRVIALLQRTDAYKRSGSLQLATLKPSVILKPGDNLKIYLEADTLSLSDEQTVSAAGDIKKEFYTWNDENPKIHVAGLTIPQAEIAVENSLGYLNEPMVRFVCKRRNMTSVRRLEAVPPPLAKG